MDEVHLRVKKEEANLVLDALESTRLPLGKLIIVTMVAMSKIAHDSGLSKEHFMHNVSTVWDQANE